MSAGTGIVHSEHNLENESTHMFQIWIRPKTKGLRPQWAQSHYEYDTDNGLQLLVAGDNSAPLHINQAAKIYLGQLSTANVCIETVAKYAYLVVFEGSLGVNGLIAHSGDGVAVTDEAQLSMEAVTQTQFLLISLEV